MFLNHGCFLSLSYLMFLLSTWSTRYFHPIHMNAPRPVTLNWLNINFPGVEVGESQYCYFFLAVARTCKVKNHFRRFDRVSKIVLGCHSEDTRLMNNLSIGVADFWGVSIYYTLLGLWLWHSISPSILGKIVLSKVNRIHPLKGGPPRIYNKL